MGLRKHARSLCSKVVYGFGVKLAKFSRGIGIGFNETAKDEKHAELNYHYFHGLGARKEGNDVHCFDNEERTFEALSKPRRVVEFCKYKDTVAIKTGIAVVSTRT